MAVREEKPLFQTPPTVKTSLTPMIDVVFLLIIFFLCGQFRKLEGDLTMRLPEESGVLPGQAEIKNIAPREIRLNLLTKDGRLVYSVNERLVTDWHRLRPSLSPIVILDFADDVPVGATVRVYDFVRSIGINDVSFAAPARQRPAP